MDFTFAEWKLIHQAVTRWAENSADCMNNSKPSEEPTSCYQIFKRQVEALNTLAGKIDNSII